MFLSRANLFLAWIQVMEPLKTPWPIHLPKGRHTKRPQKTKLYKTKFHGFLAFGWSGNLDANSKRYTQCIQLGFSVDL